MQNFYNFFNFFFFLYCYFSWFIIIIIENHYDMIYYTQHKICINFKQLQYYLTYVILRLVNLRFKMLNWKLIRKN